MPDVPSYDQRNGRRQTMPPGAPRLPTLTITFNPETQGIGMHFEPDEFKTWDMIAAVLRMGEKMAEFNANLGRMVLHQQKAMEAAQAQELRSQLKL